MKQLWVFALGAIIASGCNDKAASTTAATDTDTSKVSTAAAVKYEYPYTLKEDYQDWQPGDQMHAVNVLKGLKAYETGDIASCITAFGDSIDVRFDGFQAKVSNDSLKKMFTESRGKLASQKIEMHDWESVVSKNGKKQFVTMWYKQTDTDLKGKVDSMSVVDDLEIVNGKAVSLDQKIQRFPAKKM